MRAILFCAVWGLLAAGSIFSASYQITERVTITNTNVVLSRLSVIMPLAQTCQYQTATLAL